MKSVNYLLLIFTGLAAVAGAQTNQAPSPISCGSTSGFEAIGTLYKSGGPQKGPGWLQLTIVVNGKTYLDSEEVHWSEGAKGQLNVYSENVDTSSVPRLKLTPTGSYMTTKAGAKITFGGCGD